MIRFLLVTLSASPLSEAAREYPNLFAIGADTTKSMGYKPMLAEFPDRVINNGIAEQNMAMIGAGIAASGGRAVVATYAPFCLHAHCRADSHVCLLSQS